MGGASKDDARIVELIDSLNDELIEQCCGGHALAHSV
jgi:hypothetical protein